MEQVQYKIIRDQVLSILEDKDLSLNEKFEQLNVIELIQTTDIYQAELLAQNQELLEKEEEIMESRIEFETLFNLVFL